MLHSAMDMKATIGGRLHSALYYLAVAMRPRMLMTLDGDGALLAAPARVGQAVDVVAQDGFEPVLGQVAQRGRRDVVELVQLVGGG